MKMTAYDKPLDETRTHRKNLNRITRYPGRVVSYNTAYQRMKRDPNMSLHDACTTPPEPRRKTTLPVYDSSKTMREQFPKEYIDDLQDKTMTYADIDEKWVRKSNTINRHKKALRHEDDQLRKKEAVRQTRQARGNLGEHSPSPRV